MRSRIGPMLPIVLTVSLVCSTLILTGIGFYARSRSIMESQLRDKLRNTAAAAAMQFTGEQIDAIPNGATLESSAMLRRVVSQLQQIKDSVNDVRFAYLMRRTSDPAVHEFVADADLSLTFEEIDLNRNGTIDLDEGPAYPGDPYEWEGFPVLGEEAFLHPSVDKEIGMDQWGPVISGYAPIQRANGTVAGILGVDMDARDFVELSHSIFSPVALFLILIAVLAISIGGTMFLWRRRVEMLERLEMERSGLLRLAFHQLGGPLTIINWSIEELEDQGPVAFQRIIANIQEGVKRLTIILKTLKDADIVHAGKIEYRPEPASLTLILERVVKESGAKIAVRRQHVDMELAGHVTMNLDQKLIAGVAEELLTNAIDFSKDGGRIVIRSKMIGSYAEFSIQDFGYGIPEKDLGRLFSEFVRGSNATKHKADGNGLGLYIVYGIVQSAGGKVTITSEEGKGTTVTVRLPVG